MSEDQKPEEKLEDLEVAAEAVTPQVIVEDAPVFVPPDDETPKVVIKKKAKKKASVPSVTPPVEFDDSLSAQTKAEMQYGRQMVEAANLELAVRRGEAEDVVEDE